MTTVIVSNRRAQPLFLRGLATPPPDISGEVEAEIPGDIEVEITDEIEVEVCSEG